MTEPRRASPTGRDEAWRDLVDGLSDRPSGRRAPRAEPPLDLDALPRARPAAPDAGPERPPLGGPAPRWRWLLLAAVAVAVALAVITLT